MTVSLKVGSAEGSTDNTWAMHFGQAVVSYKAAAANPSADYKSGKNTIFWGDIDVILSSKNSWMHKLISHLNALVLNLPLAAKV